MILKVNLKQIGQRKSKIAPIDFEYEIPPDTVRELIIQTVTNCVNSYNKRVQAKDLHSKPLTKQQITDMADIGKIAFGINYSDKEQSLDKAIDNALQSFEDGIYRVFINNDELENLDDEINLNENDLLTFIRLTMLAGRMW